ncbi:DUF4126 family protein [Edaphobacter aggregans]|uniref:DUF4126 family protein n=1 Tax=Edaphobacter aggregans TaxID=570835 RepID=UPI000691161A|nr:DUF4126 family protein [Edaphobacter aggregans]
MLDEVLTWLMAIPLLGFIAGMRAMTAMAAMCWFAFAGQLPLAGSWAWWCARLPVAIAFTLLALLEYAADWRSWIPRLTHPAVLITRLFFAGLAGAIVASALNASGVEGVILGVLGAIVGALCTHLLHQEAIRHPGLTSWHVTLAEDIFAIGATIVSLGIITS